MNDSNGVICSGSKEEKRRGIISNITAWPLRPSAVPILRGRHARRSFVILLTVAAFVALIRWICHRNCSYVRLNYLLRMKLTNQIGREFWATRLMKNPIGFVLFALFTICLPSLHAALRPDQLTALFVAKSPSGETLNATQIRRLVIDAPWPKYPSRASSLGYFGTGIFLLSVRADGTISSVETLRSTGHTELDTPAMAALKKWRFQPKSVAQVRVPVSFRRTKTRIHVF
jgi:TonB family protein